MTRRALAVVLGALVAFLLVLAVVARLSPAPHGPRSSSYATSPQGLAAYAAVLERAGHPVRRLRVPVRAQAPATGDTLVVLDPDVIEPAETRAISRWVRAGGRLITTATWALGDRPRLVGGAPERRGALAPVPGVSTVDAPGGTGWQRVGGALPLIGPAGAPLVLSQQVGRGEVVLLADASPLQNRRLAYADNAALGLALARGPVDFLETVHGYGAARGLAGLPARGKWVLIGLALAGLVAVWSAGRRFGPPEEPERPLPARTEYVEALAAALARTKEDQ